MVTPADDHTRPSRTKIASGSTLTFGWRVARREVCIQWVAARLPSRTPAAASMKLPTHTEHTRRHFAAFFPTHRINSRSRVTSSTRKAPGTIKVSIGAAPSERTDFVTRSTPSAVLIAPPRIETTKQS